MARIGDLLAGGSGKRNRNEITLTDDLRKDMQVVDLTDRNVQAPTPQRAQGNQGQGGGRGVGRRLTDIGEMLSTPGMQRFMGTMAQAFTGGFEQSAGTILGREGVQQAEARAVQNMASRLLAGEDVGDIEGMDVAGISPEGIAQAEHMAAQRRGEELEQTRIEQEDRRINLQSRAQDLREEGFELDQEIFDFDKEMSEFEVERAERILDMQEQMAPVERRLTRARADALEFETQLMRDMSAGDGELSPEDQSRLFRNTESLVKLMNQQIEPIEEELEYERSTLNRMLEDPAIGRERRESQRQVVDYLTERLNHYRGQQVNAMQKLAGIVGIELDELPERPPAPVVEGEEETEQGFFSRLWDAITAPRDISGRRLERESAPTGTEPEAGTTENPIRTPTEVTPEDFPSYFESLPPGTIGEYRGAKFLKDEDGNFHEL